MVVDGIGIGLGEAGQALVRGTSRLGNARPYLGDAAAVLGAVSFEGGEVAAQMRNNLCILNLVEHGNLALTAPTVMNFHRT